MYEKLPEQLKKDGRFCLWKYEERNGRMQKCRIRQMAEKRAVPIKIPFRIFDWQSVQWMVMTESVWVHLMISAW